MFGLFDLIGSSFLPLMQFGFWVFGLSEQAEALGPLRLTRAVIPSRRMTPQR